MILRMWRGTVQSARLAEYVEVVERTRMAGYRSTPGNHGAQILTRDLADGLAEIVTVSWWTDYAVIREFAGSDIAVVRYFPEDQAFLVHRDPTVQHFEVTGPRPG